MKSLLKASSVASLLLLYKDKSNSIDKTKGSTECTLKLWTNYICNNMFAIRENYSVSNFTNKETTISHRSTKDTIEKKIYGSAFPQNVPKKKKLLLLCSHEEYNIPGKPIINAIKENLDKQFDIITWMDNIVFPIAETRSSIEMFLQSMYSYDGVILLLTGDDIRQTTDGKTEQVVRDNLIFELGACMAHFGPKRTFVMIPDDFNGNTVTLPSYFRDVHLYRFRRTNPIGDTSIACGQIINTFNEVGYKYCDIGLPAKMSVTSYIDAFLAKVVSHVKDEKCNCVLHNNIKKCNGNYKIGVVLDEKILTHNEGTRIATNYLCKDNKLTKTSISFNNNRNINLMFKVIDNEVWIIDVPTIMEAFIKNIKELNTFWGTRGVKTFVDTMIKSELEKFTNDIIKICAKDYTNVRIIENIEYLGLTKS